ncbi:MAG: hypothetical protein WAT19_16710, partial [Ferruginibacter sp.]
LALSAVTRRAADLGRRMDDRFVSGSDLLVGRDLFAGCHPDVTGNAAVRDFELWINYLPKSQIDRAFRSFGVPLNTVPVLHEVFGHSRGGEEQKNPDT